MTLSMVCELGPVTVTGFTPDPKFHSYNVPASEEVNSNGQPAGRVVSPGTIKSASAMPELKIFTKSVKVVPWNWMVFLPRELY